MAIPFTGVPSFLREKMFIVKIYHESGNSLLGCTFISTREFDDFSQYAKVCGNSLLGCTFISTYMNIVEIVEE